ncbi:hypothetical protein ILYODFUR_032690 [Ilyodon furcidens]|uniref:Uncharacterized protein n=1 Tax=Ilyodon furcidens TaxID=33524 RepID=A0ABV0VJM7_9TELE
MHKENLYANATKDFAIKQKVSGGVFNLIFALIRPLLASNKGVHLLWPRKEFWRTVPFGAKARALVVEAVKTHFKQELYLNWQCNHFGGKTLPLVSLMGPLRHVQVKFFSFSSQLSVFLKVALLQWLS